MRQPNFKDLMKIAYRVAEHCFVLNINEQTEVIGQLSQYEPFKIPVSEAVDPLFELEVVDGASFIMPGTFVKETFQDDDGSQIEAGHVGEHPSFKFLLHGKLSARVIASPQYDHAYVVLDYDALFGLNNALMVMYALSTSNKQTCSVPLISHQLPRERVYVLRQERHRQEYPFESVAQTYRRHGTDERRQSRGETD